MEAIGCLTGFTVPFIEFHEVFERDIQRCMVPFTGFVEV